METRNKPTPSDLDVWTFAGELAATALASGKIFNVSIRSRVFHTAPTPTKYLFFGWSLSPAVYDGLGATFTFEFLANQLSYLEPDQLASRIVETWIRSDTREMFVYPKPGRKGDLCDISTPLNAVQPAAAASPADSSAAVRGGPDAFSEWTIGRARQRILDLEAELDNMESELLSMGQSQIGDSPSANSVEELNLQRLKIKTHETRLNQAQAHLSQLLHKQSASTLGGVANAG